MVLLIYSTLMVGYPVIVLGLLLEVRRPTLDLRLHRNRRWLAAGAFLLGIFALINAVQAFQEGQTLGNWLLGSLAMETSSFALLFGILFLTRSTPQRSPSYRVILIGAVLFEALLPLLTYALAAVGIYGGALWLLRKGKG